METIDFSERIYLILSMIPSEKVTTYGDLAKMAGSSTHARQVGYLLKKLPEDSKLPWHRVINHSGKITVTGLKFITQRQRLLSEDVVISEQGYISLSRYRWMGD